MAYKLKDMFAADTEEQRELLRQFAALRNEPLNEGSQVKQRGGLFSRLKDQFK